MVVVTERARDALLLLKVKVSAEIDVPEIAFRLAPTPAGEP